MPLSKEVLAQMESDEVADFSDVVMGLTDALEKLRLNVRPDVYEKVLMRWPYLSHFESKTGALALHTLSRQLEPPQEETRDRDREDFHSDG